MSSEDAGRVLPFTSYYCLLPLYCSLKSFEANEAPMYLYSEVDWPKMMISVELLWHKEARWIQHRGGLQQPRPPSSVRRTWQSSKNHKWIKMTLWPPNKRYRELLSALKHTTCALPSSDKRTCKHSASWQFLRTNIVFSSPEVKKIKERSMQGAPCYRLLVTEIDIHTHTHKLHCTSLKQTELVYISRVDDSYAMNTVFTRSNTKKMAVW